MAAKVTLFSEIISEFVEESLRLHWANGHAHFQHYFHHRFHHGFHHCPRSPAAGDDLKRNMAQIPLLFVMRDDLKRNMAQIPLLFVCLLEFRWAIATPTRIFILLTVTLPATEKVYIFAKTSTVMKRIIAILFVVLPLISCGQPQVNLHDKALELCQYIPDHVLKPEAKEAMTPEFFLALSEAFDAPVADFEEIGDNEWLWYFVTGNGGSEPAFSVKSVSQTDKNTAKAVITVLQKWEDGSETDPKDYEITLKQIDNQWLLDDFDGKKAECQAYVRAVREKYATGAYVKYLESYSDLKKYIPVFEAQVKAFYEKYGE